jgi:hypothetical protein
MRTALSFAHGTAFGFPVWFQLVRVGRRMPRLSREIPRTAKRRLANGSPDTLSDFMWNNNVRAEPGWRKEAKP